MKLLQYLSIIFFLFIFSGCDDTAKTTTHNSIKSKIAYFIDSSVEGIEYKSGDISGITDKNGKFYYHSNSNITFQIGSLNIGNIDAKDILKDSKVYPTDIVGVSRNQTNHNKVVKILQALQSLDNDDNPDNGIKIEKKIRDKLSYRDISLDNIEKVVQLANKNLVDKKSAIRHFEKTLQKESSIIIDTIPPKDLNLTQIRTQSDITYINLDIQNDTEVFINKISRNISYNDGKYTISLNTFGSDGLKTFEIYLEDAAGNKSHTQTIKILKDTTKPIFHSETNFEVIVNISTIDFNNHYNIINPTVTDKSKISYTLVSSDYNIFEINKNNGIIYFKKTINQSNITKNKYEIEIQAYDGKFIKKQKYNIFITSDEQRIQKEQNLIPIIKNISLDIFENISSNTIISKLRFENSSYLSNTQYTLSGIGSDIFNIRSNGNIIVQDASLIDYEQTTKYNLKVRGSNIYGNSNEANITINILNRFEHKPTISDAIYNIDENISASTKIGDINITDRGDSDIISYRLIGHNSQIFTIKNTNQLYVKENMKLDYERQNRYNLKLITTNQAGATISNITININNISERPILQSTIKNVAENLHIINSQRRVGSVTIQSSGDSPIIDFEISNNDKFQISNTGMITLKDNETLDYETVRSYNLKVKARNDYGYSNEVLLIINILDVYDVPPSLIPINQNGSIPENGEFGDYVGQINILQQGDSNITSIIFLNQDNTINDIFAITNDGNITLNKIGILNADIKNQYKLKAIASNKAGKSNESNITIDIVAKVYYPPILANTTLYIAENSLANSIVGNINITKNGNAPTQSYTISGIGKENFIISNDGKITVSSNSNLDYESKQIYTLQIYATNRAGNSNTIQATINITNIADVVPSINGYQTYIDDNDSINSFVGFVLATDRGDSAITNYDLKDSNGDISQYFAIDNTGFITVKQSPLYKDIEVHHLKARAKNSAGYSNTADVIIHIRRPIGKDGDNDYLPDDIEALLGLNPANADENNNGILDGLESSGEFGDQFFDKQWHIRSLGTVVNPSGVKTIVGHDLDVLPIYKEFMGYNHGNPIIVSVVDTGVDISHEDLNMDLSRTRNAKTGQNGTTEDDHGHGTACAGIIGAKAFNEKGVRGIAPFVKIAGNNWLSSNQYTSELEKAWYSGVGANDIAISSNSWGSCISKELDYEEIMKLGSQNLRDGKGRLYVKSAGNGRNGCAGYIPSSSNVKYTNNNQYVITVSALSNENKFSSYSSPGANLTVSGYAGHYSSNSPTIGTTLRMGKGADWGTWSEDTNKNYTYAMNGTSAAGPTVAGSLALVLEACPDLTYRDVKYLIAKYAKKIDDNNPTWVRNKAYHWHSTDYGFGLINPKGMIQKCINDYTNLPPKQEYKIVKNFNTSLTHHKKSEFEINYSKDMKIEWVGVTIYSNYSYSGELEIDLVSPSNTTSQLLFTGNELEDYQYFDGGGRLSSMGFFEEHSGGTWTIKITPKGSRGIGNVTKIKLEIVGH